MFFIWLYCVGLHYEIKLSYLHFCVWCFDGMYRGHVNEACPLLKTSCIHVVDKKPCWCLKGAAWSFAAFSMQNLLGVPWGLCSVLCKHCIITSLKSCNIQRKTLLQYLVRGIYLFVIHYTSKFAWKNTDTKCNPYMHNKYVVECMHW